MKKAKGCQLTSDSETLIFIILTLSLWEWKFEKIWAWPVFPEQCASTSPLPMLMLASGWGLSYSRNSHQQRWPKFGNSSPGVRCLPSSWTSRQFLGKTMNSHPKSEASEGHRSWTKLLVARMEVIWGRGLGVGGGGRRAGCASPL